MDFFLTPPVPHGTGDLKTKLVYGHSTTSEFSTGQGLFREHFSRFSAIFSVKKVLTQIFLLRFFFYFDLEHSPKFVGDPLYICIKELFKTNFN